MSERARRPAQSPAFMLHRAKRGLGMNASVHQLAPERRLRRLELTITRRLDGLLHGQHLGLLPGAGSELAGSREYRPGEDEVRFMDWAVTARTAVPHVREVDAERELTTWLLVDATPSMDFGTAEIEKRELAVAATAAVGFLTHGAGNKLGAHVRGPDGVKRLPARTGRTHLFGMLRTLLALPRGAEGADPGAARRGDGRPAAVGAPARSRRGGLGFPGRVAGRAAGPPIGRTSCAGWRARHQVLAVEVTDPRELELPDVGILTLVDPETGQRREVSTGSRRLRERYAAAAAAQRQQVRQALRRAGAAHLPLRTDRDWVADIVRHVYAQRRLAVAAPPRGGAA